MTKVYMVCESTGGEPDVVLSIWATAAEAEAECVRIRAVAAEVPRPPKDDLRPFLTDDEQAIYEKRGGPEIPNVEVVEVPLGERHGEGWWN